MDGLKASHLLTFRSAICNTRQQLLRQSCLSLHWLTVKQSSAGQLLTATGEIERDKLCFALRAGSQLRLDRVYTVSSLDEQSPHLQLKSNLHLGSTIKYDLHIPLLSSIPSEDQFHINSKQTVKAFDYA